eukprot:TRINITY_DN805_c0_g1_i2.p1 TRINITY_DN805_c0_g1~~TRINITY_DN805_c0_g1_i2.p1  ORF type:complete len:200 (+),score=50.90 TRINITY_DN805_c0_g1_i2:43-642(+)
MPKLTEEEKALIKKYSDVRKIKSKGKSRAQSSKASIEAAKKILAAEREKGDKKDKDSGFKQSALFSKKRDEETGEPSKKRQKTDDSEHSVDHSQQESSTDNNKVVCVADLPETDEATVQKIFSQYGAIQKMEAYLDQSYVLIFYENEASAQKAISSMDGQIFGTGSSKINVYKPQLGGEEDSTNSETEKGNITTTTTTS